MKLCIISFTRNGALLAGRLADELGKKELETMVYTKCKGMEKECSIPSEEAEGRKESRPFFVRESIGEWTEKQMGKNHGLLFIGACGIAVRAIAPQLVDKLQDSPVLVMDEQGRFVIPLLCGHVGGANELARLLSQVSGACPVITTATDIWKKFAVDLFAKKNHLYIENKEGIARVSAKVLEGQNLTLAIEPGHMEGALLPEKIQLVEYPPENQVDILISADKEMGRGSLLLRPREYVLGMGCRKEKEPEKIEAFIAETLKKRKIQLWQISALASIRQKKEEPGFLQWSEKHRIPFLTFSGEELMEVTGNLASSAFVKEKVGADNVCERAALKACGQNGCLAAGKEARDGMTIAIAKRDWRVAFDEE